MDGAARGSLNRTFYGIETTLILRGLLKNVVVLIVPFMELKRWVVGRCPHQGERLNRTFYGIETIV